MADTTYLLGAGINRAVRSPEGLAPPLARDFFRQALRLPRLATKFGQNQLVPLLDFIRRYWRLDKEQLKSADFDLEECFTFIDLQRREAEVNGDKEMLGRALQLTDLLTDLLFEYFSECERWYVRASDFQAFGRYIYREPSVPIIVGHEVEIKAEGVAGVRKCLN